MKRIKIISGHGWYKDYVGKNFTVLWEKFGFGYCVGMMDDNEFYVEFDDAVVI